MRDLQHEAARQYANRPKDHRFESLEQLKGFVRRELEASVEVEVLTDDLHVVPLGDELGLSVFGQPTILNHWSAGQVARLAGAGSGLEFLRGLPSDLAAECLEYKLRHSARERYKALLTADRTAGTVTARALTTTKYSRIFDMAVIELVEKIIERAGGNFSNPPDWSGRGAGLYRGPQDMWMFFIDGGSIVNAGRTERGQDDILHRGFYMSHSEVWGTTFDFNAFYHRFVCGNHTIGGFEYVGSVNFRHVGNVEAKMEAVNVEGLRKWLDRGTSEEEALIRRAKARLLPSTKPEDLVDWLRNMGLTKKQSVGAMDYAQREEGGFRNFWQAHNGVTAVAREIPFADVRTGVERVAGKILQAAARHD